MGGEQGLPEGGWLAGVCSHDKSADGWLPVTERHPGSRHRCQIIGVNIAEEEKNNRKEGRWRGAGLGGRGGRGVMQT